MLRAAENGQRAKGWLIWPPGFALAVTFTSHSISTCMGGNVQLSSLVQRQMSADCAVRHWNERRVSLLKQSWTPGNRVHRDAMPLQKQGSLIIGRGECSSNLWGYLCDRYGANPSETIQLVLEPPNSADAIVREPDCRFGQSAQITPKTISSVNKE